MSKIAIVTDSNSGITQEEGRRLGVSVIPMPFFINEKMYLEGITLSQDEFYQWLKSDASISTSQPSPGETMGLWDNLLKEYDEIVQIPMSSGLSATCATAMGLAQEYEGRVYVVDNQRISVTQRQSVVDAIALRDAGKSGAEIKKILEEEEIQFQYLYHFGNPEISEKGRQNHTCCSCNRYRFEFEAGTADPG